MQKVVVDSSVIVKWLNQEKEKLIVQSEKVLEEAQHGMIALIAPQLARYEIGNALLKKKLSLRETKDAFSVAYRLPVNFITETKSLAKESYRMANEAQITYYDASFVALAKQENATLVTDNPKHQARVKDVKVVALVNYK